MRERGARRAATAQGEGGSGRSSRGRERDFERGREVAQGSFMSCSLAVASRFLITLFKRRGGARARGAGGGEEEEEREGEYSNRLFEAAKISTRM